MDSNLIDRLEKIQRLIDGATTAGEAEAATAAFYRLLAKYNLDESVLNGKAGSPKHGYDAVRYNVVSSDYSRIPAWKTALLNILAGHHFCKPVQMKRRDSVTNKSYPSVEMIIIGKPENIQAVTRLFERLVRTYERLSPVVYRQRKAWNDGYPTQRSWDKGFLLGCAAGVQHRLLAEQASLIKDDHRMNALVVTTAEELDAAAQELLGATVKKKGIKVASDHAFEEGFVVGSTQGFEAEIDSTDRKALA